MKTKFLLFITTLMLVSCYEITPTTYEYALKMCSNNEGLIRIMIREFDYKAVCNNGARFIFESQK